MVVNCELMVVNCGLKNLVLEKVQRHLPLPGFLTSADGRSVVVCIPGTVAPLLGKLVCE